MFGGPQIRTWGMAETVIEYVNIGGKERVRVVLPVWAGKTPPKVGFVSKKCSHHIIKVPPAILPDATAGSPPLSHHRSTGPVCQV